MGRKRKKEETEEGKERKVEKGKGTRGDMVPLDIEDDDEHFDEDCYNDDMYDLGEDTVDAEDTKTRNGQRRVRSGGRMGST